MLLGLGVACFARRKMERSLADSFSLRLLMHCRMRMVALKRMVDTTPCAHTRSYESLNAYLASESERHKLRDWKQLGSRPKSMTKVDGHDPARRHVYEQIAEMPVAYSQHVLAAA
jgi:hypothetical protein